MHTKQEVAAIQQFCAEVGTLVFPQSPALVEQTAIEELHKFFREYPLVGTKKVIIGRAESSDAIAALCENGTLQIGSVAKEDDGYEIKTVDGDIVVAGANPRAVLHGVYALEEWILAGMNGAPDTFVVPHFRKRSDALGHYHNGGTYNFGNDTIDAKKAEYLARLRINQFCACFDGSPFGNNLSEFVHSDVFPFQREPSFEAVNTLQYASKMLAKYGIDFIMMIWEPAMPALFAPLDQYPPEALGRVRRPWGGDENHLDTTLCVNSPLVQEHYRNITQKFVREYPDVKGFFFYNLDGSAWICTPDLCPRCKENLVDSDPSKFYPWETQAKMVALLADAAHEVDPNYQINFWAATNIPPEVVPRMIDAAKGVDFLTVGAMGGDHDLYIAKKDDPCQVVKDTIERGEKLGAPTYIYYAYNKLEAIQTGFPNPYNVAESIQTFQRWGIKYLMEVTGSTPALNQVNAITMRQFQTAPDTDLEEWAAYLAKKQFGEKGADKAIEVWRNTRDAFDAWKDFTLNPLRGSQFLLRMGLFSTYNAVDWMLPPLTPDILPVYEEFFYEIMTGVETWLLEEYRRYAGDDCIGRFQRMQAKLKDARTAAKELIGLVPDDEYVGICYYSGAFEGLERHTMREYAKVNAVPIEIAHLMCTHKTHLLQAVRLLTNMRDGDPANVPALQKEYCAVLREELATLKELRVVFTTSLRERPCLALTGMCECEIVRYIGFAESNIEKITAYLEENA